MTGSGPRGALDFASREGPHTARPRDGRGGRGPRGCSFRGDGVGGPKGGGAGREAGDRRRGHRATPGQIAGGVP
jgi:hypothetical protein